MAMTAKEKLEFISKAELLDVDSFEVMYCAGYAELRERLDTLTRGARELAQWYGETLNNEYAAGQVASDMAAYVQQLRDAMFHLALRGYSYKLLGRKLKQPKYKMVTVDKLCAECPNKCRCGGHPVYGGGIGWMSGKDRDICLQGFFKGAPSADKLFQQWYIEPIAFIPPVAELKVRDVYYPPKPLAAATEPTDTVEAE